MLVHPVLASRFVETTIEGLIRIRQHLPVVRQGGTFHIGPEIMVSVMTQSALEQVLHARVT